MRKNLFRTSAKRIAALARAAAVVGSVALGGGALAGCTAEVAAEAGPANYYAYPYTYYEGRPVYFVNGRWYYPAGNRWYYYRRVPPELARRRAYVHPAHPGYGRGGGPRPGHRP
jgi:hypothetical protein